MRPLRAPAGVTHPQRCQQFLLQRRPPWPLLLCRRRRPHSSACSRIWARGYGRHRLLHGSHPSRAQARSPSRRPTGRRPVWPWKCGCTCRRRRARSGSLSTSCSAMRCACRPVRRGPSGAFRSAMSMCATSRALTSVWTSRNCRPNGTKRARVDRGMGCAARHTYTRGAVAVRVGRCARGPLRRYIAARTTKALVRRSTSHCRDGPAASAPCARPAAHAVQPRYRRAARCGAVAPQTAPRGA